MRGLILFALVLLGACAQEPEPEEHTVNFDLDDETVMSFLQQMNSMAGGTLDVQALNELGRGLAVDTEDQMRLKVSYQEKDTELLYHVWREQADWVHIYLSSPSGELITALDGVSKPLQRPKEE